MEENCRHLHLHLSPVNSKMARTSKSEHTGASMPAADKFDSNPLLSQLSVSGFTPGGPIPHGHSYLQQDVKKIRTPTRTGGDISGGMSRSASGISVPPLPRLPSFPLTPPSRPSAPPQLVRSKTTPELQRNTKTCSLDPSPVASSSSSSSPLALLLLTDPRTWTPSEVTLYLSHVLCLVPRPLLQDLHAFVRQERLGGKAFLRLREADLEVKGVNWRWRRLMTEASIRLRRDALKRRVWSGRQHDWEAAEETEGDDTSHSSDLQWSPSMQPQQRVITATLKRIKDRQYVRGAVEALESTASCDTDLSYSASPSGSPSPRPLTRHLSSASSSSSSSATSTEVKVPVKEGFVRGQAMNIASRANEGAVHRSTPSRPVRTADTEMGWNVRQDSHRANAVRSTDDSTFRPAAQLAAEESGTYDEEDLITSTEPSSDTFAAPLDQTLIDAILAPDRDCHFDADAKEVATGYDEVMQASACYSQHALGEQGTNVVGHDRSPCLDTLCQEDQHLMPRPASPKQDGKAEMVRDDWQEPNDLTISRAHGKKTYAPARNVHDVERNLAHVELPSDEHLSTCPHESAWARLQQSHRPLSAICDNPTPCEDSNQNQAEDFAAVKPMETLLQGVDDQCFMLDVAPGELTSDLCGEEPQAVDLGPDNWDSEEEEAADESQPSWEMALRGETTDAQAQWDANFVLLQQSTPPRPSRTLPNQDVLELGEHRPGSSVPDVERPAAGEVEADVPESMPTADLCQAILDRCKAWLPFTTTEKSSTGNAALAKTSAACDNDREPDQPTSPPQSPSSSSLPLSSLPPYLLGLGAGVAFVIASEVLRRR